MAYELLDTIESKCELGEGIFYDASSDCVWWTDILGKKIYCYEIGGGLLDVYDTPAEVAAFTLTDTPDVLLVAFFTGFAKLNIRNQEIEWIAELPELGLDKTGIRLNDGGVDTKGRFWVGAMVQEPELAGGKKGKLYCLDVDGTVSVHDDGFTIFNGSCWSPCGETYYFADSAEQTIYTADYDPAQGDFTNKRVFTRMSGDTCPDGACTDRSGALLSAQWATGEVLRFNKDGSLDQSIPVPTVHITCVTTAGKNAELFFVTSARAGLTEDQLATQLNAGDTFVFQMKESRGMR